VEEGVAACSARLAAIVESIAVGPTTP